MRKFIKSLLTIAFIVVATMVPVQSAQAEDGKMG